MEALGAAEISPVANLEAVDAGENHLFALGLPQYEDPSLYPSKLEGSISFNMHGTGQAD